MNLIYHQRPILSSEELTDPNTRAPGEIAISFQAVFSISIPIYNPKPKIVA